MPPLGAISVQHGGMRIVRGTGVALALSAWLACARSDRHATDVPASTETIVEEQPPLADASPSRDAVPEAVAVPPEPDGEAVVVPSEPEPRAAASLTPEELARVEQAIVDASIAAYDGNCPCPEHQMKNGRRCGKTSAHSRQGGEAPLCYAHEVTPEMVDAFLAEGRASTGP
jgi:hypothetical protein